ncbi:MAG: SH3 domain-containing protein [Salinisphaeraceae bacterium]
MPMSMIRRAALIVCLAAFSLGAAAQSESYESGADAFSAGDYDTAMAQWRPLAEEGNAAAQYNLGLMYANGFGVTRNAGTAREWYRKSAEQGYARAQHNLGVMLQNGELGDPDYTAAARWYREAAEQGEAAAQNNLAMLYVQGLGVEEDRARAARLAAEAARQDNESARRNLPRLLEGLPAATIKGNNVNVRTGPGTEHDKLLQTDEGAQVHILTTEGDWKQIIFTDGYAIGWIAEFLLDTEAQE